MSEDSETRPGQAGHLNDPSEEKRIPNKDEVDAAAVADAENSDNSPSVDRTTTVETDDVKVTEEVSEPATDE